MSASSATHPNARRLSLPTRFFYGFGSVAFGVKDNGFSYFLQFFYAQVVGLPAATVGLAIMFALVIDAFIDPVIGQLSDNTRSKWGRRHPFMYLSAIPVAASYLLLWNPPKGWDQPALIAYLVTTSVLIRSFISCYEIPSAALAAELTTEYDERTRLLSYRYLFGWAGGLTMLLSAYLYFLAPTSTFPNGLLNRAGYPGFALLGAALMMIAILVSALGTHGEIERLPQPAIERQTLRQNFSQLWATVQNRAFVILMIASVCAYTNQGISYAMSNYLYTYVWGFRGMILVWLTVALFVGVILAFIIAPRVSKRGNKHVAAAWFAIGGMALNTAPYWLRLLGLFPHIGDQALVPLLFCFFMLGTASNISAFILGASMMADVVEDSEVKTGRRSEGVFFAGSFFVQKCTSGIGILAAGTILTIAGFPKKAVPGLVPVGTIDRLTIIYSLVYLAIAIIAALMFRRFPFGRAEHEARLAKLVAPDVSG